MRFPLLGAALLALLVACPASAAERIALVIGNDRYPSLPDSAQPRHAAADADAVAVALERAGFEVARRRNVTQAEMRAALAEAAGKAGWGDVLVMFFAGQGLAAGGRNYLLPSDIPAGQEGEAAVLRGAVAEEEVADILAGSEAAILLLLDASRENPFWTGGPVRIGDQARGLAPQPPPARNLVKLYSAGYGEVAIEDPDPASPTSPFGRALAASIREPLDLAEMAERTRRGASDVAAEAGLPQRPVIEGEFGDSLSPPEYAAQPASPPAPAPPDCSTSFPEAMDVKAYESFLQLYPDCPMYLDLAHQMVERLRAEDQQAAAPEELEAGSALGPRSAPAAPRRRYYYRAVEPPEPGAGAAAEPGSPDAGPAPATEPQEPQFPWPPPQASASYVIPRRVVVAGLAGAPRWGDVQDRLEAALDEAGYYDRSLYFVPGGFAMVTRLERIDGEGNPIPEPDRWPAEIGAVGSFSLAEYLAELFFAEPGYYRVIAFIATPRAFVEAPQPPTPEEATRWVRSGLNTLPFDARGLRYSDDFTLTALVYEFRQPGAGASAEQLVPSRLPGRTHLARGRIVSLLGD